MPSTIRYNNSFPVRSTRPGDSWWLLLVSLLTLLVLNCCVSSTAAEKIGATIKGLVVEPQECRTSLEIADVDDPHNILSVHEYLLLVNNFQRKLFPESGQKPFRHLPAELQDAFAKLGQGGEININGVRPNQVLTAKQEASVQHICQQTVDALQLFLDGSVAVDDSSSLSQFQPNGILQDEDKEGVSQTEVVPIEVETLSENDPTAAEAAEEVKEEEISAEPAETGLKDEEPENSDMEGGPMEGELESSDVEAGGPIEVEPLENEATEEHTEDLNATMPGKETENSDSEDTVSSDSFLFSNSSETIVTDDGDTEGTDDGPDLDDINIEDQETLSLSSSGNVTVPTNETGSVDSGDDDDSEDQEIESGSSSGNSEDEVDSADQETLPENSSVNVTVSGNGTDIETPETLSESSSADDEWQENLFESGIGNGTVPLNEPANTGNQSLGQNDTSMFPNDGESVVTDDEGGMDGIDVDADVGKETIAPSLPSTALEGATDVRVTITTAFVLSSNEALSLDSPDLSILNMAFEKFVEGILRQVSEEERAERRRLRRGCRRLVAFDPDSVQIYDIEDTICPGVEVARNLQEEAVASNEKGGVCQKLSAKYDLILEEGENEAYIEERYQKATEDSMDEGGLNDALKEVDPDSRFTIEEGSYEPRPQPAESTTNGNTNTVNATDFDIIDQEAPSVAPEDDGGSSILPILAVSIGAAVLICVVGLVYFYMQKRKQQVTDEDEAEKEEEEEEKKSPNESDIEQGSHKDGVNENDQTFLEDEHSDEAEERDLGVEEDIGASSDSELASEGEQNFSRDREAPPAEADVQEGEADAPEELARTETSASVWKAATDADGQVYYFNERGETQWEKPVEMQSPQDQLAGMKHEEIAATPENEGNFEAFQDELNDDNSSKTIDGSTSESDQLAGTKHEEIAPAQENEGNFEAFLDELNDDNASKTLDGSRSDSGAGDDCQASQNRDCDFESFQDEPIDGDGDSDSEGGEELVLQLEAETSSEVIRKSESVEEPILPDETEAVSSDVSESVGQDNLSTIKKPVTQADITDDVLDQSEPDSENEEKAKEPSEEHLSSESVLEASDAEATSGETIDPEAEVQPVGALVEDEAIPVEASEKGGDGDDENELVSGGFDGVDPLSQEKNSVAAGPATSTKEDSDSDDYDDSDDESVTDSE